MRHVAEQYYSDLSKCMRSIRVTDGTGTQLDFYHGIEHSAHLIKTQAQAGKKLMFIGNGASAAISSHMSTDFWKNGGIRAVAFNDSSGLTCIGNDFGYKHLFEKPIEIFADAGDVLVAISSSGRSENILLGAKAAGSNQCKIITLSGFAADNPLCSLGDINYYVPAQTYGPVEIIHHSICHCILDTMMRVNHG